MSDPTDQTADLPAELLHRARIFGDLCHEDAVCMQRAADEIEQLRELVSKLERNYPADVAEARCSVRERDRPAFEITDEMVERVAACLWTRDYLDLSLVTAKELARKLLEHAAQEIDFLDD